MTDPGSTISTLKNNAKKTEDVIINDSIVLLNGARKIVLPPVLFIGGLIYFYIEKDKTIISYLALLCLFLLMYLISGKQRKYKFLMFLGISIISQAYMVESSKDSKTIPYIYQLIFYKSLSELVMIILDYYGFSKATNKFRPMITIILLCYFFSKVLTTSDPVANLAVICILAIIGVSFMMFEVFGMNIFTSFMTTFVVSLLALVYAITELPIICKSILKKKVKGNTGVTTAGLTIILPILIFSMALYETRWYCLKLEGGKPLFKYKPIKQFLVGLVMATVVYVLVIGGLFLLNTYLNYSSEFKDKEGMTGFIKKNMKRVLTNPLNILILLALSFPIFTFYFTQNYSTN